MILNEPIIQKAFHMAALEGLSPEQRSKYEQSLMQYRVMHSVVETALEEREVEIARAMKNEGDSLDKISRITGLSFEEIQKL